MKLTSRIDALYVTRFQKEREPGRNYGDYPTIDADFLKGPEYSKASVMHPLPRVGELDRAFDTDARASYFEQAAYGVPIRMALISLLMGTHKGRGLARFDQGFATVKTPTYEDAAREGVKCRNPNCIVHDALEQPFARAKFYVVPARASSKALLRCFFCETDIDDFVVAHRQQRWFKPSSAAIEGMSSKKLHDYIFFADEARARESGYAPAP